MGYLHIWNRFDFHGTYGAFAAARDGIEPMVCNVTIEVDWSDSGIKETRAYRRDLKRTGKKVPALRKDTLHDELFVVFGPKMSAASAVKRLHEVIKHIEKGGMLVGMGLSGEYVTENSMVRSTNNECRSCLRSFPSD
jgi:hypothetical protein